MMNKEKPIEIYDRIYDEFVKLIKKEVNEVIITPYELNKLDKKHRFTDPNTFIDYERVSFTDILRELGNKHNIEQEKDLISGNYIFRLGDVDDE